MSRHLDSSSLLYGISMHFEYSWFCSCKLIYRNREEIDSQGEGIKSEVLSADK